jgi:hypothetical protein
LEDESIEEVAEGAERTANKSNSHNFKVHTPTNKHLSVDEIDD